jgi:ribonuclease P protein component
MLFCSYSMKLPVIRLQKDISELFSARRSLARAGKQTSTISSLYQIRDSHSDDTILFLFHIQKKIAPKAHDRNKLRRWIRESVRASETIQEMDTHLKEKKQQVLLLLRADFKPSPGHSWNEIKNDVEIIFTLLQKKI